MSKAEYYFVNFISLINNVIDSKQPYGHPLTHLSFNVNNSILMQNLTDKVKVPDICYFTQ